MCSSMRLLFRNRAFIVIALAYGLCNGMSGSWASTLDLNLQTLITDKGQAQTTGGWVSFTTTIGASECVVTEVAEAHHRAPGADGRHVRGSRLRLGQQHFVTRPA